MASQRDRIKAKVIGTDPVTRDAFLYLEPKNKEQNSDDFAQCKSCFLFTGKTCQIHGPDRPVSPEATCGFYAFGDNVEPGTEKKLVTPEQSGLVKRNVRCENCVSFKRVKEETRGTCILFDELNRRDPQNYDLDTDVHKHGCCNAQRPL